MQSSTPIPAGRGGGQPLYLVSACLVGLTTRYDGRVMQYPACVEALKKGVWIPFCPEQLGGLPTPRTAADLVGGDGREVLAGRARVLTREGKDVTANFVAGARQVLAIARSQPVTAVFLKSGSPSCGLDSPRGVTAALLQELDIPMREF